MSWRHYLVSGRVQGVGFRRFVEKRAKQHHVSGLVRNLADGRVECLAKGAKEDLLKLESAMRQGPMLSSVSELTVNDLASEAAARAVVLNSNWQEGLFAIVEDGETPWLQGKS